MRPLAVIGHLALDLFAGAAPRIGGAPWYAGRALRLLGDEATLFAKCGTDDRARFQRRLASLGLPASLSTGGVTTSFTFLYDRDAEFIGAPCSRQVLSRVIQAVGQQRLAEETSEPAPAAALTFRCASGSAFAFRGASPSPF